MRNNLLFCFIFILLFVSCQHVSKRSQEVQNPLDVQMQKALEAVKNEDWQSAEQDLLEVKQKSVVHRLDLTAQAIYELSRVYEKQGQLEKSLISLQELDRFPLLSEETLLAEVPSRKAVLFQQLGQTQEALKSLQQAELGLSQLRQSERSHQIDWAKLYYQMGQVYLQVESSNEQGRKHQFLLQSLKNVQAYLFKSIALNQDPWSLLSQKKLIENYNFFWIQTQENSQEGIEIAAAFLDVLYHAELFQPLSEQEQNVLQTNTFIYIERLKNDLEKKIYSQKEQNLLTTESLKHNSLKRNLQFQR